MGFWRAKSSRTGEPSPGRREASVGQDGVELGAQATAAGGEARGSPRRREDFFLVGRPCCPPLSD